MKTFYTPGIKLMQQLRIRRKLGLMGALLLVPLLMFMTTVALQARDDIDFVQKERWGLSLVEPMSHVLHQLQINRGITLAALSDDDHLDKERDKARQQLKELIGRLNTELDRNPDSLTRKRFTKIESQLTEIVSGRFPDDKAMALAWFDRSIAGVRDAMLIIGEESGLLFDPIDQSYFLMDLATERIVTWSEDVSRMRATGAEVAMENRANMDHTAALRLQAEVAQQSLHVLQSRMDALLRSGHDAPATWDSAKAVNEKLLALTNTLVTRDGSGIKANAYTAAVDDAHSSIARMSADVHQELGMLLHARLKHLWFELIGKAILCLAGLSLVAYLSTCFYADFYAKVEDLQRSIKGIAKGDLSMRLSLEGQDELVQLGHQLNNMTNKLSILVSEVRSSAVRVGQAGLSVSDDGRALSRHTEEQASSLKQSVLTVGELSSAVSNNAEAAISLEQMTAQLRTQAEEGSAAMEVTVESIHSLQDSARRIGEINNVINDIAFQTNLLALNASVEAARAGESGRGFAVVAAEVRSLAQRCAEAAAEVHDVIERTTELVDQSVDRIGEVNSTLGSVMRGVGEVSMKLKSIASASEQQSMGLQAVTATVGNLDDLTHQNANLVDRSSHSSKALVSQAEALRKSVAHIQLRQGTADEAQAMVEKAVARVAEMGWSRACAEFNRPGGDYVDRDLYLFGLTREGNYVVMSKNPEWVGRNIDNIPEVPTEVATAFLEKVNELSTFGRGWVEYEGPQMDNPEGLRKTAYIVAVDEDTFLGCGVLRRSLDADNALKLDQTISVITG